MPCISSISKKLYITNTKCCISSSRRSIIHASRDDIQRQQYIDFFNNFFTVLEMRPSKSLICERAATFDVAKSDFVLEKQKRCLKIVSSILSNGADDGNRTRDLRLTKAVLYRLSHVSILLRFLTQQILYNTIKDFVNPYFIDF